MDSGRKGQVGGFGCLNRSLIGPEQSAGDTGGHRAQQRLSQSDKVLLLPQGLPSHCFLHKAGGVPRTGGVFTEPSLKGLNAASALGLLLGLTAEG